MAISTTSIAVLTHAAFKLAPATFIGVGMAASIRVPQQTASMVPATRPLRSRSDRRHKSPAPAANGRRTKTSTSVIICFRERRSLPSIGLVHRLNLGLSYISPSELHSYWLLDNLF